MKFTAKQIAALIHAEIVGNPNVEVWEPAKIEEAKEGNISFLGNPKYLPFVYTTNASILIVSKDFIAEKEISATLLKVENPYSAFTQLLQEVQKFLSPRKTGIEEPCYFAPSVELGKDCYVGAFAYLGENVKIGKGAQIYPYVYLGDNVEVGDNSIVYPNVVIYKDCKIGKNCVIHAGSVLGSDGFGFAPQEDGTYSKIPQMGNVVIEDNVEIGANVTIDRATMGSTFVRNGVKLDNLVHLAHNVEIGANTVIAAQTGISGSTKLGESCVVGGQVGMVGHITLAKGTKIGAKAGMSKTIKEENTAWWGAPAQEYKKQVKTEVLLRQLDTLFERVKTLEGKLK